MRLRDLLNFIDKSTTSGMSFDDIKNEFTDVESEDLKRLLKSALDLNEIKQNGKGRGTKYYGINHEIVIIRSEGVNRPTNDAKKVDGAIDISKCANTKEKIQTVLSSSHCLSQPIKFSYREKIAFTENGKELHDFILTGVKDIDVGIFYDRKCKENAIYTNKEKNTYNSLWIGNIEGTWTIKKIFNGMANTPEIREFESYNELEKCLRTLLTTK